ncbi:Hint domain-containing protein [Paracoccus shandongensis]|uniref:Hint domain-containing protein n=1 Tax=Paracoccus shandongensis TaxID=2816048 RepID=UPI001F2F0AC8|nr:Hint domain-containing protein [Paracoccus shandongensis]
MAYESYQLTMLTFGQPVTTLGEPEEATGQAPWSNVRGTIDMTGARVSAITISDDDALFHNGRYGSDTTGQTLTTPVTFGNDEAPTPAGTALAFYNSSVIRTPNADGGFDEFMVLFPRQLEPDKFGSELGGRYSVLVMPIARPDGTHPIFSLAKAHTFKAIHIIGRNNDSVVYAPLATGAVPCFAMDTLIDTVTGPRPVEALQPGDLILTRDHGPQVLRWQGGTQVTREGLETRPNLRPILIRQGALGAGSPRRDLVVSPQHRILVRSRIAHRLFQDAEILVAAKHLVGLPGIEVIVPAQGVRYFHLLFDRHEIVMSEGAWSESLYTGPEALKSVSDAARREILALFPELVRGTAPAPARRLLTGREARQLSERQSRNIGKRSLVEPL